MRSRQTRSAAVATVTAVAVVAGSSAVWGVEVGSTTVRVTDTAVWSPPSPDPSGITYIPAPVDRLVVSDAEVDEIVPGPTEPGGYQGKNLYTMTRQGALTGTGTTQEPLGSTTWSVEPTGLAYADGTMYVVDDDKKSVFTITSVGTDGIFGTADDTPATPTSFRTSTFGNTDPEGIAYDPVRNELLLLNGQTGARFYRLTAGVNGVFDGVAPNGDDIAAEYDLIRYGVLDPEGIAYDAARGTILVTSDGSEKIFELDRNGALLNTINIAGMGAQNTADIVVAPSSTGSGTSYYLVDRGLDNNSHPGQNDGKVFEITANLPVITNFPPVADAGVDQLSDIGETITLSGGGADSDATDVLTFTWSQVSGPGTVSFAASNAARTTATFSATGVYVLRLTVRDPKGAVGTDEAQIRVLNPGDSRTVALPVISGSDDAQQGGGSSGTFVDLGSADNELGNTGGTNPVNVLTGLRFGNLPVPRGSRIVRAQIQFKVDEGSTGPASFTIVGEDSDNAGTYLSVAGNISARPRTTATTAWDPPTWNAPGIDGGEAGPAQLTPELRAIVQEIIDRPGWQRGNAVAFMFSGTGRRTAEAKDGLTPPVLQLDFETPAQQQQPPGSQPGGGGGGNRQPTLTASVVDAQVRVGRSAQITGELRPALAGQSIVLQRLDAAGWTDVSSQSVAAGPSAAVRFVATSSRSARVQYRLVAPAFGSSPRQVSDAVAVGYHRTSVKRVVAGKDMVTVKNTGAVTVDLEGWTLKNKRNGRSVVLPSFTLKSGAAVKVHTGKGRSTAKHLFLSKKEMWGKHGKAVLRDEGGGPAGSLRY
jgi:hypothetical protein